MFVLEVWIQVDQCSQKYEQVTVLMVTFCTQNEVDNAYLAELH